MYDANGNVTSRQGSSITWSSYNYPTMINDTATGESVAFLYGPDRHAYFEQTKSSSGTETTYHVGGMLDIVTTGGVSDYRHYIYAGAEPIAMNSRKSSGVNLYYLLSDHQGSIAAITNSSGAVVVGESFTAYGSRRNPTTWSGAPTSSDLNTIAGITRHGYTFQDALGQMALNDMVGRVQDAVTGRFLSADPALPDPTDPQSYNRYSYTINNPLSYVDPSGFQVVSSGSAGGGGGDGDDSGCPVTCVTVNASADPSLSLPSTDLSLYTTGGGASENTAGPVPLRPSPLSNSSQGSSQQNDPDSQLQEVTVTATKCCASVYDPPLVPSLIGVDDLAGVQLNWGLNRIGCTGTCQVLATVVVSAVAPEASEEAAIEETTTLYRAVSQAEYDDIMESGVLRAGPNSFESGKWFAESPEDATAWGDALEGPGNFQVIQVQFPSSVADEFFSLDSLDGIGPARFGTFDQIGNPTISLWTGP